MPRYLWLMVSVALALGACSTRRNSDFCCTEAASCRASGEDLDPVVCTDSVRSYCDDNGVYGNPRTCIADPISNACDSPNDCTNAERPFCIGNICVQCENGSTCDNPAPACNPTTHLCGPCLEAADCTGDPAGDQCAVGSCVECVDATDCPSRAAPFCEPTDHTCRGCRLDSECASLVCDRAAGTCAAETEVLYVELGAPVAAPCTRAAPCGTITAALLLAGANRTIKIGPGRFNEAIAVTGARTIRLHGSGPRLNGGTIVGAAGAEMHVVAVATNAVVTLDDLVITGANGNTAPNGVRCTDATINLRRVLVDLNQGGGVRIASCDFAIVNSMITRNGGPGSAFGAVSLSDLVVGRSVKFEFNTLVGNAGPQASTVPGVNCNTISIPVSLDNNIIYNPGTAAEIGDDGGDCVARFSVIGDPTPGPTNTNVDPRLLSATDVHLMADSPVQGFADPAATLDHDLDGDVRPQGTGRDPGADELVVQ